MGKCEFSENCAIFELSAIVNNTNAQKRFRENFCNGNESKCARHLVWTTLGKEYVPVLMLPHQREWANQLLSDQKVLQGR